MWRGAYYPPLPLERGCTDQIYSAYPVGLGLMPPFEYSLKKRGISRYKGLSDLTSGAARGLGKYIKTSHLYGWGAWIPLERVRANELHFSFLTTHPLDTWCILKKRESRWSMRKKKSVQQRIQWAATCGDDHTPLRGLVALTWEPQGVLKLSDISPPWHNRSSF